MRFNFFWFKFDFFLLFNRRNLICKRDIFIIFILLFSISKAEGETDVAVNTIYGCVFFVINMKEKNLRVRLIPIRVVL